MVTSRGYGESVVALMNSVADVPGLLLRRVQVGLEALKAQPNVNSGALFAIGYCFGGTGVLELARSGEDLLGVVCFHGMLTSAQPARKGCVRG